MQEEVGSYGYAIAYYLYGGNGRTLDADIMEDLNTGAVDILLNADYNNLKSVKGELYVYW